MTTVQDKQLVDNVLKHATTHNRVIEEEACWRQILQQRKQRGASDSGSDSDDDKPTSRHQVANERRQSRSPVSEASWKNSSQRSGQSQDTSAKQQALDAYERELRHKAKREIELAASQKVTGVVVPNVTMHDRWGHDGWEALQNTNAREPTPAYRPRVQPASYRLAPLVCRTIENPIRSESLSSDLSHKSSTHQKSKSKRRRKSKKRKRRRHDDESDSESQSSRSRSASSDASRGTSDDDKRSSKKKSRRKRRKDKKRRKRYSKRRGRKSRHSRKRYDSSSSRSATGSRSRSRSRSLSRSRTRRTSYSSAGSRSRRSSCSCSCCSRSGSRSGSGSFSSRSRSRSRSSSSSGRSDRRSRATSATSFDSQRAANQARSAQASREQTVDAKSLQTEAPTESRSIRIAAPAGVAAQNGPAGQPIVGRPARPPESDEEERTNFSGSDVSHPKKKKSRPATKSPSPMHSQCSDEDVREGVVEYASPDEASPQKPVSSRSSKSPGARELQQPTEKGGRGSCKSGDEPDDLYDPVLAVSDTPSQSPKSREDDRSAQHSDSDACDIVEHDSDEAEPPARQTLLPPIAPPPLPSVQTPPQQIECPPPSAIPLPSPRPDKTAAGLRDFNSWAEAHSISLSDIIPPPMPRDYQPPQEQQKHKTLFTDYNGRVEEFSLDSICIPSAPPPPDMFPTKTNSRAQNVRSPRKDYRESPRDSRHDSQSSERSTPVMPDRYEASAAGQGKYACPPHAADDRTGGRTAVAEPAGKAVIGNVQSPAVPAKEKLKRRRRGDSPQDSSDRSLSSRVTGEHRHKRSGRYSDAGDQQDDLPRTGGHAETTGYPTHNVAARQQPVQANPPLSPPPGDLGKERRRKGRVDLTADIPLPSKSAVRADERMPMTPTGVRTTAAIGEVKQQGGFPDSARYESQEEGEILSPCEEVKFKRRKRKHGKHHSDQRELPSQSSMTISPFKLPSRQLPTRKQQPPEPYMEVRQPPPPIPQPKKSKKKSRDRQQGADFARDEPPMEVNLKDVAAHGEPVQRRDRRARDASPIGLSVPSSLAEAPIEKVSKWQEYGTVAHPSITQTRPELQPKVVPAVVRGKPRSSVRPESDSGTDVPEIPVPQIKPVSVADDSAARHQPSVAGNLSKKEKKRLKKEKKRAHSPAVASLLPAELLTEEAVSSRKRKKRKPHILFTEALEAFTQQLLETKRALLPFRNLSQLAYEATALSTAKQRGKSRTRSAPSPVPEELVPTKKRSKKHHRNEPMVTAAVDELVVDPLILSRPVHPRLEDKLSKVEKARARPTPQQVKQDRPAERPRKDSDGSATDATSDNESSSSGSGSSSSDSADEQPGAGAPQPTGRQQQPPQPQQQPTTSFFNGMEEGRRRPTAVTQSKPLSSKLPQEPQGHQKRNQPISGLKGAQHPVDLDERRGTGAGSHVRKAEAHNARRIPPPKASASSSRSSSSNSSTNSSSESSSESSASDGISSLQSDEEIAWREPS